MYTVHVLERKERAQLRLSHFPLPDSLPRDDVTILRELLETLEAMLSRDSPFVRMFKHVCEIPEDQVRVADLIIDARRRPPGEHVRAPLQRA